MSASPSDLLSIPLFDSLSEEELAEVATWFEVKDVDAGVQLVGEGATGRTFFVISEGEFVVRSDGEEIARLRRGDFFGELALLGAGRRTATVTTVSPSRVLLMFGTDFNRFRSKYPDVAAELEGAAQERLPPS